MSSIPGKSFYISGFDPRSIPGCQLWLDAADRNTLSITGSNITQWNDKSINGYNIITRTTAQYPVYASNFNGTYPTVQGLGSAYMTTNAVIPSSNVQSSLGLSFFLLVSYQSGVVFTNYTFEPLRFISFEGSTRFDYGQPNVVYNTGTSFSNAQIVEFFVNVPSSNLQLYQNGTLTVNANAINIITNTYTGGQFSLFAKSDGQYIGAAKVSESIIYNRFLSSSERQQLEGYLAAKWGLTANLPATHPFKSLRPFTRQFQPVDISGCALWIDAADATTVTLSGSNITALTDKSSNAYAFATASGFTYNVTKFNTSYPSFYSPTSTAGFSLGSNTSVTLNQPFTTFAVGGNLIAPASGGYFWDSTSNANRGALLSFSPGRPTMFAGVELFSTNSNSFTNALILSSYYNSTSSSIFEFGVNRSSNTNVGTQNISSLRLGAAWSSTTNWNGHICEILFFNRLLSTTERQQMEGYLANKWGLRTNLPATHPFKLYPPLTVAFTPVQISGCSLWLDAADRNTLTLSGSNVSSWADKSGRSNNSTAVANPSPTWSSNLINGTLPAVWVSNSMIVGTLSNLAITGNQVHCFMIVNRLPADRDPYAWYLSLDDGANTGFGSTTGTSLQLNGNYQLAWCRNNVRGGGPGLNSNMSIINAYNSSSNTYIAANGGSFTLVNSGVTTNFNLQNWRVGGWQLSAQTPYWVPNFYIGELIIYNSALPVNQYQQLEGYLAHKWGLIGNLPASHPYKKIRP